MNDPITRNNDRRIIVDTTAAVWGDYGQPDEPAEAAGDGTCAITPLPRGTMQSSGGLLTYVDCNTGILEVVNTVADATGDPLGLRFADEDDGTSNPTLGTTPTFGEEHSDNAIVRTGDCNADPLVPNESLPGPLGNSNNTGDGVRAPDAGYLNPEGSVAGKVNYTFESAPLPTQDTDANAGPESTSNCDFDDDRGSDAYSLEGDFNSVSATNKIESDWNFAVQIGQRGGFIGPATGPAGIAGGAPGIYNDAGLTPIAGAAGESFTQWFGGSSLVKGPFQTLTTRGTVAGGDAGADIDRGYWLTFYATTSPDVGTTPGGSGKYGSAQCGLATEGIQNGWNCARSAWNLNPDGSPVPDPLGQLSYPGKSYNHRDVDCYDGDTGAGVGFQPAFYGPGNCRTP